MGLSGEDQGIRRARDKEIKELRVSEGPGKRGSGDYLIS